MRVVRWIGAVAVAIGVFGVGYWRGYEACEAEFRERAQRAMEATYHGLVEHGQRMEEIREEHRLDLRDRRRELERAR